MTRSYFIVARANRNPQLPALNFKFPHEVVDTAGNSAKVMVFQLLSAGGCMAKYGPACHDQVRTGTVKRLIHGKILLFRSQGGINVLNVLVEKLADFRGRNIHSLQCF